MNFYFFFFLARAEEEATTPTKLTNQLFIKSANNTNVNNTNSVLNGEETCGAATFVSVVSTNRLFLNVLNLLCSIQYIFVCFAFISINVLLC